MAFLWKVNAQARHLELAGFLKGKTISALVGRGRLKRYRSAILNQTFNLETDFRPKQRCGLKEHAVKVPTTKLYIDRSTLATKELDCSSHS
jgi:hypothetical protein